MRKFSNATLRIAYFIHEEIFGNIITYALAILFIIIIYICLPFEGFSKWNIGIGLFANSTGSNLELIVDIGIAVTTVGTAKAVKSHKDMIENHHDEIKDLHTKHSTEIKKLNNKLDKLGKNNVDRG